ncbi:hypothetical protein ATCC90586_010878 [Pythium insidiosum]|nr:hypothetical protein ATCC90586_010878 [Pythium insidiosum]
MPTTAAPPPWSPSDACFAVRDWGLLDAIRHNTQRFCEHGDSASTSQVTLIRVANAGVRAMVFRGLELDLRRVTVDAPIHSLAQDGGGHDPRFVLNPSMVRCSCGELATFASEQYRRTGRPLRLWDPYLAKVSKTLDEPASLCGSPHPSSQVAPAGMEQPSADQVVEIPDRVVVLARRDDHNPFFQVSTAA